MEGDCNTNYFHSLVSHRSCNYVDKLKIGNNSISGNENLREGAMNFFQQLYTEEFELRPKPDGLQFKQICEVSRHSIEEFSEEEILCYEAVMGIKPQVQMVSK